MHLPLALSRTSMLAESSPAEQFAQRSGGSLNQQKKVQEQGRRKAVLSFAALLGSQAVSLWPSEVRAEEKAAAEDAVCQNPLGCKIPEKLAPPKKVFKGIPAAF